MMGSIFCSSARSLEASCHSRLIVLGGGGAKRKGRLIHSVRSTELKWRAQDWLAERRGKRAQQRTARMNAPRNQPSHADETHRVQKDFETITRLTDGRPGTMWTESDVVGYKKEKKEKKKKNRRAVSEHRSSSNATRRHAPAFFSSTDSTFQSFF